jgi:hypothetical protein
LPVTAERASALGAGGLGMGPRGWGPEMGPRKGHVPRWPPNVPGQCRHHLEPGLAASGQGPGWWRAGRSGPALRASGRGRGPEERTPHEGPSTCSLTGDGPRPGRPRVRSSAAMKARRCECGGLRRWPGIPRRALPMPRGRRRPSPYGPGSRKRTPPSTTQPACWACGFHGQGRGLPSLSHLVLPLGGEGAVGARVLRGEGHRGRGLGKVQRKRKEGQRRR